MGFKVILKKFKGNFREVSTCFKGVSRKCQGCSKNGFWVHQGIVKDVSRKFHGCLKED